MIEQQVIFDASAHSADAIQRAAYRLSDRLALDLKRVTASSLHVADQRRVQRVGGRDCRRVPERGARSGAARADQGETEGVRNVILALAFSNTGLTEDS